MRTLPTLAREWNVNEAGLRSFVRRRPAMQKLGERIGSVIAYSPAAAEKLRKAFKERNTAK